MFVHRLVLMAFVGPPPAGYVCDHKDGSPSNNRLDNLEWVTHKENLRRIGDQRKIPGSKRGKYRYLSSDEMRLIRHNISMNRKPGWRQGLADELGISYARLAAVVIRERARLTVDEK